MTHNEINECLRNFMARHFEGRTLNDDDDIFELGFGNSLFALELVAFVEQQFGIEIGSEDLDMKNFRSIQAITELVQQKRALTNA